MNNLPVFTLSLSLSATVSVMRTWTPNGFSFLLPCLLRENPTLTGRNKTLKHEGKNDLSNSAHCLSLCCIPTSPVHTLASLFSPYLQPGLYGAACFLEGEVRAELCMTIGFRAIGVILKRFLKKINSFQYLYIYIYATF